MLADVAVPDVIGRRPEQLHHVMRESAYLNQVWDAYRFSTDEKAVLRAFLDDVVMREIAPKRRPLALLDVGPDDGTLTRCLCARFDQVTLLEPDPASLERLRAACASRDCASKRCEHIGARFPDADLGDRRFDVVLLSHVLYYFDRSDWLAVLSRAHRLLRPGGVAVAAYVCDEGGLGELLRAFGGRSLDFDAFEDDLADMRREMQPRCYRMASEVCAADERTLLHLLCFLMADRHASAPAAELGRYVRRFLGSDGCFRIPKVDGAVVIRAHP